METKFQTSFIPKKPLPTSGAQGVTTGVPMHLKPTRTGSWFMNFGVFLFIISIGLGAVLYAWKIVLLNNQNSLKQTLSNAEKSFNYGQIQQLQLANVKIEDAKKVLASHMALSSIFDVVAKTTAESIRFLSMDVTTPLYTGSAAGGAAQSTKTSNIELTFSGSGTNLSAVAFQAQVLGQLDKYGLTDVLKNPVVAEPSIENDGSVSFKLSEEINPGNVIYMNGGSATPPASQTNNNQ